VSRGEKTRGREGQFCEARERGTAPKNKHRIRGVGSSRKREEPKTMRECLGRRALRKQINKHWGTQKKQLDKTNSGNGAENLYEERKFGGGVNFTILEERVEKKQRRKKLGVVTPTIPGNRGRGKSDRSQEVRGTQRNGKTLSGQFT